MLVIDQGLQHKPIVSVTTLDYNKKTIFGVDLNGKRTWLGKYDTEDHALVVCRDLQRAIDSGVKNYTMP